MHLMKPIRLWSVAACLLAVTSVAAQNLITEATDAVRISKSDFADTIKIKVMDGAVIAPVEIEGRTRNLLFDTGSPLGLWVGQKEDWMRQMTTDSLTFGDINKEYRKQTIYLIPTMRLGSLLIEQRGRQHHFHSHRGWRHARSAQSRRPQRLGCLSERRPHGRLPDRSERYTHHGCLHLHIDGPIRRGSPVQIPQP